MGHGFVALHPGVHTPLTHWALPHWVESVHWSVGRTHVPSRHFAPGPFAEHCASLLHSNVGVDESVLASGDPPRGWHVALPPESTHWYVEGQETTEQSAVWHVSSEPHVCPMGHPAGDAHDVPGGGFVVPLGWQRE